ncbi:hypothetical protein F5B20DRAFT_583661 [Whalleya microplaca]|nr:hypothetical protein F5B20DRAFT_583661 [Whalleya microplaca]
MKFQIATVSAGFVLATSALTIPKLVARGDAADMIAQIAPTSTSCAGADDDCRTNEQAAIPLITGMIEHGLNNSGPIAAVLALTAFESQGYKYKKNVSPGRPGQGTSNMQMFKYNLQYAKSIPALQSQVKDIQESETDVNTMNKVRDLVKDDKYNFGSGPWFMATFCADAMDALLVGAGHEGNNVDDGFSKYMSCVGVTLDSERTAFWQRAKQAFGLK